MKVFLTLLAALAAAVQAAPAPQNIAFPEAPLLPQANLFPQTAHRQDFPQNTRLQDFSQAMPIESQVWPIIPYSYSYSVSDPETGNYHNKAEMKNELGEVFGSYSVLMPDNIIYTTTYNVTGTSGFVARVEKSLPQPVGPGSSSSGSSGSSSHVGSFPAIAPSAATVARGPGLSV